MEASVKHLMELSDKQYATLCEAAARLHETPERLIERMLDGLANSQGDVYYTDDEFLRELGADENELAALAQLDAGADADADE